MTDKSLSDQLSGEIKEIDAHIKELLRRQSLLKKRQHEHNDDDVIQQTLWRRRCLKMDLTTSLERARRTRSRLSQGLRAVMQPAVEQGLRSVLQPSAPRLQPSNTAADTVHCFFSQSTTPSNIISQ